MNRFKAFAIFLSGCLMAAAPLAAQDPPPAKAAPAAAPITDAERPGVQQAVNLGWLVYSYDQAAWHGTDAMLEDVPDARTRGIAGWIVNDIEDGWETVFFRPAGSGYEAVWAGVYDGRKVIRRTTYAAGQRQLGPGEVALVEASMLARGQNVDRCSSQPFNTVVIPTGKPDGGLYAYLLVPQETTKAVPLGGHHRFEIVDGKIAGQRQFTKSCITLALEQDGKRPVSLFITHLLDQTPTEIHVFSVYAAELPMFVSTGKDRIWAVEISNGKPHIRVVK